MADLIMVVDAAVIVPVNMLPLIDDTDFKTIEAAVAYNAAGMDLRWNFVTVVGVQTSTAVTPTTASNHDWTHLGDGIYSMEIPASGGTVSNDTEGFGWWSGVVTGVLPFRGPVVQFSPADIAHGLVTGTEFLPVDGYKQEYTITSTTLQPKKPDGTTNTGYSRTLATDAAAEPIISST